MSAPAMEMQQPMTPLGIIAGGGYLPRQVIDTCRQSGRDFFVVAVEGEAEAETVEGTPHAWLRIGALGKALEHFKTAGAQELVLAGKIGRPKITALRPDAVGAKLIARLGASLFGGDAAIFRTIIAFLEEHGFRVVGVDDIIRDLVAPEGPMGKIIPDKQAQSDIALGARVVRAIGSFDIGQAVIVKNGLVLGIEAAEGTDALIARCGDLKTDSKGGVLVKARKPMQENRVDLPTIGLKTVERMLDAGFAGIAIEAKHSLVVGRRDVIRAADSAGLFVIGFSHAE